MDLSGTRCRIFFRQAKALKVGKILTCLARSFRALAWAATQTAIGISDKLWITTLASTRTQKPLRQTVNYCITAAVFVADKRIQSSNSYNWVRLAILDMICFKSVTFNYDRKKKSKPCGLKPGSIQAIPLSHRFLKFNTQSSNTIMWCWPLENQERKKSKGQKNLK